MSPIHSFLKRARGASTPLLVVIQVLLLGGGVLIGAELWLRSSPLAALGTLAVTAAATILAWKVQATSIESRKIQRGVTALPAAVKAALPTALPATSPSTPPPAAPSAPVDPKAKLRSIGVHSPVRATGQQAGRQAAAVLADPDAPMRLYAATQATAGSQKVGRAIAFIGSDELCQLLSRHGTVYRLHPSISHAEMLAASPEVLVIEEDSFTQGPWSGALDAQGAPLLLEVRSAMAAVRRRNGFVYTITTQGVPGIAAEAVRADTTLIDDSFTALNGRAEAPDSLLKTLSQHRSQPGRAR